MNSATTQITQAVRDIFEVSCHELFRSLDCDIVRVGKASGLEEAPLAYIDAGSDDIEIIIALHVPLSVLSMTYPNSTADKILAVDESKLEDWISELANQLMGRFKNKMLDHGCRLKIGLPTMRYDAHEVKLPIDHHDCFQFFFDIDKEHVECSVYIQVFNDNFVLTPPAAASNATTEGELELF